MSETSHFFVGEVMLLFDLKTVRFDLRDTFVEWVEDIADEVAEV